MDWTINYYTNEQGNKPVKEWIDSFTIKPKNKIFNKIAMLKDRGLDLAPPHVKHLEDKLYELRIEESTNIYRVIYFAHTGRQFVLLHGFTKKTQKTPKKDIDLAKTRMKEVIDNG